MQTPNWILKAVRMNCCHGCHADLTPESIIGVGMARRYEAPDHALSPFITSECPRCGDQELNVLPTTLQEYLEQVEEIHSWLVEQHG